jgi:hypothetical protein
MTAISIPGRPRSAREMEMVASMRPCNACGDRSEADWYVNAREGGWSVSGSCPACGEARQFLFDGGQLLEPEPAAFELGGPEPSTVLDAMALELEIAFPSRGWFRTIRRRRSTRNTGG